MPGIRAKIQITWRGGVKKAEREQKKREKISWNHSFPLIVVGNVRLLSDKMDEFGALTRTQREYLEDYTVRQRLHIERLTLGCDFHSIFANERVKLCYMWMLCVISTAKLLPSYKNKTSIHSWQFSISVSLLTDFILVIILFYFYNINMSITIFILQQYHFPSEIN